MNKIKRTLSFDILKIIKIAIGSSIAIIIANFFGLAYSTSAGIITLLSIQDTKRQTLLIAKRRMIACFLAFITAFALFEVIGYKTYVFGIFLFIFITVSYILKIEDGIAMCSVLVTHFLIEKNMSFSFVVNEVLIFIIGISCGILFNLFMPSKEKTIKENIDFVEKKMKVYLTRLGKEVIKESRETDKVMASNQLLIELQTLIGKGERQAYEDMNNTLLSSAKYYISYFAMRKEQVKYLKDINKHIMLLTITPSQAYQIHEFIEKIEKQFREHNNANSLLVELEDLKYSLKGEDNPSTREEFENRAILYMIIHQLEGFLIQKRDFVQELTQEEIKKYWK